MAESSSKQDSVDASVGRSAGLDLRIVLAIILVAAIAAVFWSMPGAESPTGSSPAIDAEGAAGEPDDPQADAAPSKEGPSEGRSDDDWALRAARRMSSYRRIGEADPAADENVDEIDDELKAKPKPRPKARRRRPKIDLGPVPEGVKAIPLDGGRILIFPDQRRIWMGGRICQNNVAIEYFAVFVGGKDHEAVMTVDANPILLNSALLILELKSGGGVRAAGDLDVPTGDPVRFYVEWKTPDGKIKRVHAEELIWRRQEQTRMRDTPWIYTGSRFTRDRETRRLLYMAAQDGVMAAVYRDPNAIFNNPRPSGSNDDVYGINTKLCPEIGTPVKIVLEAIPAEEYRKLRNELLQEVKRIKAIERRMQEESRARLKAMREARQAANADDDNDMGAPDDPEPAPAAP